MPLSIRSYLPSDRQAVWNLHISALEAVGALGDRPVATIRHNADLDDIENVYLNAGGEFLIGVLDDRIVAMGGLRRMSPGVAEITRMRVDPQCWRRGYGEAILHRLEDSARRLGYTELWLDTLPIQTAAQKLYQKNGYSEFRRVHIFGYEALEAILFRKLR